MILLRANRELDEIFHRLIKTMEVNVEWTGLFAVIDNYLILQGKVRSLFFNFENRKVVTNIIDIPVKEEDIVEIEDNRVLPNVLNMVLYAFGKWNAIEGIKVEKNYSQLDALFTGILKEIRVMPDFNKVNYRFYKEGIRLTYEDVIQMAIELKAEDEENTEEDEEKLGLWHSVCWKKTEAAFQKEDTSAAERITDRLGNNFYLVGYQCPVCRDKLHMVVYPVGKELLVETEEGRVFLARAYTCNSCNSFYTPRPEKLLAEGDVYELQFGEDKKAYEDYLELLGKRGERTSNYKFNEFEAERGKKKQPAAEPKEAENRNKTEHHEESENQEETENLEKLDEKIDSMSDTECYRLDAKIEEGFFPPEVVQRYERKSREKLKKRLSSLSHGKDRADGAQKQDIKADSRELPKKEPANEWAKEQIKKQKEAEKFGKENSGNTEKTGERPVERRETEAADRNKKDKESEIQQKYAARMQVLPRLSAYQIKELKQQLQKETALNPEQKAAYLKEIDTEEKKKRLEQLKKKAEDCGQRNYTQISRVIEEIEQEALTEDQKKELLEPLYTLRREKGEKEVEQLVKGLSGKLDRKQYKALRKQLKAYPDIDVTKYTKDFDEAFEKAEKQEIANMVNRARKISREDYTDLLNRLAKQDFDEKLLKPYEEKIREKIAEIDRKELDRLCPDMDMTFEEGLAAYETIEEGMFLPELKTNALEMLDKRLKKLKADECEQLVKKMQDSFSEKIKENPRIHFYPARKILLGNAKAEEVERFQTALAIFAADRSRYELPIVLFDTSKNGDGREGVMISSDNIFYGSRFDAGTISILSIVKVSAKNGLLNKGIYVSQKNGAKTRLHYVVDNSEVMDFAENLEEFITYLQEKPESRKIDYLAKEKHDIICCLRCGYTYKEGNVCPKCGYKVNN